MSRCDVYRLHCAADAISGEGPSGLFCHQLLRLLIRDAFPSDLDPVTWIQKNVIKGRHRVLVGPEYAATITN